MKIDVLTIFPKMFESPFDESIIKIAQNKGLLELEIHDLRDFTTDKHRQVDDTPYGGGAGMVMKPEPFFDGAKAILQNRLKTTPIILLTPVGRPLKQEIADDLSRHKRLLLLCGRYEGVDERVGKYLATDEISIGDYVLSGGELPAMVLIEAIIRKIKGVLGAPESLAEESFNEGLLEYPQYTKPANFRGIEVPEVLLSGDHAQIKKWRAEKTFKRTKERRPDLLK